MHFVHGVFFIASGYHKIIGISIEALDRTNNQNHSGA